MKLYLAPAVYRALTDRTLQGWDIYGDAMETEGDVMVFDMTRTNGEHNHYSVDSLCHIGGPEGLLSSTISPSESP